MIVWTERKFCSFVMGVGIILIFSILKYFPNLMITAEIAYVICFLFLLIFYPAHIKARRGRISFFEIYGLIIIFVTPFITAATAQIEFDQPYILGLLASRNIALVGSMYLIIYAYRKSVITVDDIERTMVILAWSSLIFFTLAHILIDPNAMEEKLGFVVGMQGQAKLILEPAFIEFGFFYYAFSNIASNKPSHKPYFALPFLAYLFLGNGGRILLLSTVGAYLVVMFNSSDLKAKVSLIYKFFISVIVAVIFSYVWNPEQFSIFIEKFIEAVWVVTTGQEGQDVSANARIYETDIALTYIFKNPFFGNGNISNQWYDGYLSLLGYFHPSDIGLIGIIYVYGILGLILFFIQYYFAFNFNKQIAKYKNKNSKLVIAVKGYVIYTLFSSLTTGRFAFEIEQGMFMVTILYIVWQSSLRENIDKKYHRNQGNLNA